MLVLKFITTFSAFLRSGSEKAKWLCEKIPHCFLIFDPRHKQNIILPTNSTPKGIEDVSAYPYLFAELMGHGWTAEELTKLAGGNLLRVFSEVTFQLCLLWNQAKFHRFVVAVSVKKKG